MVKVGEIYETNNCGKLKIIEYNGTFNVLVRFIETGFKIITQAGNIKNGTVRDKLAPSIYGVGFEGVGKYSFKNNEKAAAVFLDMLGRCYNKNCQENHPTYIGCTVIKVWHNFQVFCEWFEDNYIKGCHLDKDLLVEGNKIYSNENCLFVKQILNNLFTNNVQKGILPVGVSENHSGYYRAQCVINRVIKCGMSRLIISEAEIDYLKMKSNYILNDVMKQDDFPQVLIEPFTLRVNNMKDRIKLLQNG